MPSNLTAPIIIALFIQESIMAARAGGGDRCARGDLRRYTEHNVRLGARRRRDRVRERLRLAHHPDNGPSVLYPARLQRLLADRSPPSVRNDSDAITIDTLGHEMFTDRIGSPLSER